MRKVILFCMALLVSSHVWASSANILGEAWKTATNGHPSHQRSSAIVYGGQDLSTHTADNMTDSLMMKNLETTLAG